MEFANKKMELPENIGEFLPQDCMNEIYSQYRNLRAKVTEVWMRFSDSQRLLPKTLLIGLNGKKLALDRVKAPPKDPTRLEDLSGCVWYHTCPQNLTSKGSNYPMLALGDGVTLETIKYVCREDLGYTHGFPKTLPNSSSSCALKIMFWRGKDLELGDFAIYYDAAEECTELTEKAESSPFSDTCLASRTQHMPSKYYLNP